MHYQRKTDIEVPETFEGAIHAGFSISEEHFEEEFQVAEAGGMQLCRHGQLRLERINKETGDRELITVPFSAAFDTEKPQDYRIDRHVYLTPKEADEWVARKRRESGKAR